MAWLSRLFALFRPPPQRSQRAAPAAATPGEPETQPPQPAVESAPLPEEAAWRRSEVFDRERRFLADLIGANCCPHDGFDPASPRIRRTLDALLIEKLLALVPHWPAGRAILLRLDMASLSHPGLERLRALNPTLVLATRRPEMPPSPKRLALIEELRRQGLRLAIEIRPDTPWFSALADLADEFVLNFAELDPAGLHRSGKLLAHRFPRTPRLATGLGSPEAFEFAQRLGCTAFEGDFARLFGPWKGRRVTPRYLRLARLMTEIDKQRDNHEIVGVLKQDLALSYRLLRHVNSAALALDTPVATVQHALIVMGQTQLYRWLSLLLFASNAQRGPRDPMFEKAQVRARMMEQLGRDKPELDPDELFVTGLFSLLDRLLQVPAEIALTPLRLPEHAQAALLRREGPLSPYLACAESCENGDLPTLLMASRAIGSRPILVSQRHFEALAWAQTMASEEPG
ncbi:EAL and HDOD domain-containing protein [Niveibacterium terrae]|uniref:EAL and HDOD domain-containing protein n=1 Tax=Niveibacterium terrae TaxID=3373598 RepID=UPI003A8E3FB1